MRPASGSEELRRAGANPPVADDVSQEGEGEKETNPGGGMLVPSHELTSLRSARYQNMYLPDDSHPTMILRESSLIWRNVYS